MGNGGKETVLSFSSGARRTTDKIFGIYFLTIKFSEENQYRLLKCD
jgi:hypothetical protein